MTKRIALALALVAAASPAKAAPSVWATDDGDKIKQDEVASPLAKGTNNPIWSPGAPIRLLAAKNETVAFQVVVTADAEALDAVTVDLASLATDGGAKIEDDPLAKDPTRYVGRPIERFVEHFFDVKRPSGGKFAGESLGWAKGSGPPPDRFTGKLPDALVPVEVAPAWAPYPMRIAPRTNGIVWIDVTIGKADPAGLYKGDVVVKNGAAAIATLPIEIDVADVVLPDRPVRTMLYHARSELEGRLGKEAATAAEEHLWRLYHRHRISPLHGAMTPDELRHVLPALDGSFYEKANGYAGPGEGAGDGVLSIGTYGSLGAPDEAALAKVEAVAKLAAERSLFATTDVFVYAVDEDCKSPHGAKWRALLDGASAAAKKVRVAWTCSEPASSQPVDIAIQAAAFDPKDAANARGKGKDVWAYNGQEPFTGTFLTDAAAVDPRVNGWLSGMFDIGRWFYWESTFWNDDNRGGKGPYDPFASAETFHNADGDFCMGDGVLVYPGKQTGAFASHSIGMDGVIASIRLKNWRRGIQDAGYLQLARAVDRGRADAIARDLLPRVFGEAKAGKPPSWSTASSPWFDARASLRAIATGAHPPKVASRGCGSGCRGCSVTSGSSAFELVFPIATFIFVCMRPRNLRPRKTNQKNARRAP